MGYQFIKHSLSPSPRVFIIKRSQLCHSHPKPPNVDYIAVITTGCQKITDQDAKELRADINGLLRRSGAPKPNLTKEERKALAELKRDKDRIFLTADKGVPMVVLDRKEYVERQKTYLHNQLTGP